MYKHLVLLVVVAVGCEDGNLTAARCPAISRLCGPGDIGECRRGEQHCDPATGEWGLCEGASWGQGAEVCDGKDNDCDGVTDNVTTWSVACDGAALGDCAPPRPACVDGTEVCVGLLPPTAETCDARDNDCDGQTDEGLYQPCYSGPPGTLGRGVCAPGIQPCGSSACFFEMTPAPEVCDGLDNDCDGETDEPGATPGCCAPPGPEECNGLDDDCDGQIDEGLTWSCAGATYCLGDGPEEIPCNGLDDDCDGGTDEGESGSADVGVCIDTSGSNCSDIARQAVALGAAVLDVGAARPCSLFTVCSFPGFNDVMKRQTPDAGVPAADAAAALSTIACGGNLDEYSYDVAVFQASLDLTAAPRRIVLVADEPGQTTSGLTEASAAAALGEARVLTFTDNPSSYDDLGPTAPTTVGTTRMQELAREHMLSP